MIKHKTNKKPSNQKRQKITRNSHTPISDALCQENTLADNEFHEGLRRFNLVTLLLGCLSKTRRASFLWKLFRNLISGAIDEMVDLGEGVVSVLERGGKLSFGEALRCKVRYLSDGMVFGTRGVVDKIFSKASERFGKTRKSGARPMLEIGWKEKSDHLYTMRALKKDVLK